MKTNFGFLDSDRWRIVYKHIREAEEILFESPRACIIFTRTALEHLLKVIYEVDPNLYYSRQRDIYSLVYNNEFKRSVKPGLWEKIDTLRRLGNDATHWRTEFKRQDAVGMLKSFYALSLFIKVKYSDSYENNILDFRAYTENVELSEDNGIMVDSLNLECVKEEIHEERSSRMSLAVRQKKSQILDGKVFSKSKKRTPSLIYLFKKLLGIKIELLTEHECMELSDKILQSLKGDSREF